MASAPIRRSIGPRREKHVSKLDAIAEAEIEFPALIRGTRCVVHGPFPTGLALQLNPFSPLIYRPECRGERPLVTAVHRVTALIEAQPRAKPPSRNGIAQKEVKRSRIGGRIVVLTHAE